MAAYTNSRLRRGTTIAEFVVACTLLVSLMLIVVPSAFRIGRLQQAIRQDRIAMDEVTNQLERLTQLPLDQLKQELDTLTPSEFAASRLPGPELSGTLQDSDAGYRLAVELSWNRLEEREASLTMATWIYPASTTRPLAGDTAP
jgi:hypothetical protein